MLKAEDHIQKLQEELRKMKEKKGKAESGISGGVSDQQLEDLKKDIRDNISDINKKINNLQRDSSQHDKDISELQEMAKKEGEEEVNEVKEESKGDSDLSEIKKRLEEVDHRQKQDVKCLQE